MPLRTVTKWKRRESRGLLDRAPGEGCRKTQPCTDVDWTNLCWHMEETGSRVDLSKTGTD